MLIACLVAECFPLPSHCNCALRARSLKWAWAYMPCIYHHDKFECHSLNIVRDITIIVQVKNLSNLRCSCDLEGGGCYINNNTHFTEYFPLFHCQFMISFFLPDITFMVDWLLKIRDLSICQLSSAGVVLFELATEYARKWLKLQKMYQFFVENFSKKMQFVGGWTYHVKFQSGNSAK